MRVSVNAVRNQDNFGLVVFTLWLARWGEGTTQYTISEEADEKKGCGLLRRTTTGMITVAVVLCSSGGSL